MLKSPAFRAVAGAVIVIAVIAVLRFKPWQRAETTGRQHLSVGFLPVT